MARKTRIFFATDVHGSSKCFRKFVNAGNVYNADVLILGGDIAGKALQTIAQRPDGRWQCSFIGTEHVVDAGPELEALEKLIADHGYYPYRAAAGELEALTTAGGLDSLFVRLMSTRLEEWLTLADERLRPAGRRLFLLGNDDPTELGALLDNAPWGTNAEGKVVELDENHEMFSWGYSNVTPWHTHREQTEDELARTMDAGRIGLRDPARAVVNVHVPPFGIGLDDAPVLDDRLQVQAALGQVKFGPVGSPAIRDSIAELQPVLSLHGHIHESTGIRRLGRTIAINPGSDYSTGALNGALIVLERDKVAAHQLVRG